jgi:ribonuclease E
VTKVRQGRKHDDEVASVKGSTRLEAKKQRRRDGREAGRRKQIITESEFLARRESVERTMIVRERSGRTQIAVLEDDVLVEHYVANETNSSMIGNVYLGRVQNVLPSMEAAFVDIGKGRNAVLYAGEVNWDAAGLEGQPRRIEQALKSGDTVLVQVTKDPLGHKGARLTSQISLPGRYLVYVPNSSMTGISRKLPDTERSRLKKILKTVVPEHAGVIVRTAAEGASEEELARDVTRLTAQWEDIQKKSGSSAGGSAPKLLHGEPDLTIRVVRDVFNEDFSKLVVSGSGAWEVVQPYLTQVAPDLAERASRWTAEQDVFGAHRVDEQLAKAMDRKVYLPSGGSLVIDRTEAMTVVDVNTGKFTGSGGNLEETVTRNNLEAAEEIVRQLRLRDIGGIIVVDFIDMVLESNRDLVLRRLVECLGRDRTRHQVAEVTSLGLVQMTRKRIGTGLLESFSHDCPHCHGRGVVIEDAPVEAKQSEEEPRRGRSRRSRGGRAQETETAKPSTPSPKDIAAMARHHEEVDHEEVDHEEVDHEVDDREEIVLLDDPEVETVAFPEPDPESEPESESEPEPEPEKPRVVTRTRRRSASRPAGPPASASAEAAAGADGDGGGAAEGDDAGGEPTDEAPALHVPVKRKGARKR